MTKVYRPKTLFDGKVIGKTGYYVAVPEKGYKGKTIKVIYKGVEMIIKNWLKAESFRRFPDKWGRGTYTLGYFLFKPEGGDD